MAVTMAVLSLVTAAEFAVEVMETVQVPCADCALVRRFLTFFNTLFLR